MALKSSNMRVIVGTIIVAVVLAALFLTALLVTRQVTEPEHRAEPAGGGGSSDLPEPQPTTEQLCAPISGDPEVMAVHDAACRGDYSALQGLMAEPFAFNEFVAPAAEVIEQWKIEDQQGVYLELLARVLESPVVPTQGGPVFCGDSGAIAVFSRGTAAMPMVLSEFTMPGFPDNTGMCRS